MKRRVFVTGVHGKTEHVRDDDVTDRAEQQRRVEEREANEAARDAHENHLYDESVGR